MSGADWLIGKAPEKAGKATRIKTTGELDIDAVEALMDSKRDGEKLRSGLDNATSALEALKKAGLTGEALVVLVAEKCARAKNGSRLSADTVQIVLEGLFRLGEYVR